MIRMLLAILVLSSALLTFPQLVSARYHNLGNVELMKAVLAGSGRPSIDNDLGLASAVVYFRRAMRWDPGNARAYYGMGRAYLAQGNYLSAIEVLSEFANMDPSNPLVHFELGNAYQGIGERETAISEWRKARAFEALKSTFLEHGLRYLEERQPEKARREFEQFLEAAVEARQGYWIAEGYRLLGLAYRHQGKTDLAIAAFRNAINVGASDFPAREAMAELGAIYARSKGEFSNGIELLCSAIRLDPERLYYRLLLSESYGSIGQYDKASLVIGDYYLYIREPLRAIEALRAGVKSNPTNGAVHYQLAEAYRMAGMNELASEEYTLAVNLWPNSPRYPCDR